MIIVTHEMHFARDVADRILFMDGGSVVEEGPAHEVIDHPREERTAVSWPATPPETPEIKRRRAPASAGALSTARAAGKPAGSSPQPPALRLGVLLDFWRVLDNCNCI